MAYALPKKGGRIEHPSRGLGSVLEIIPDDERGKPYQIKYDNGEVTDMHDCWA